LSKYFIEIGSCDFDTLNHLADYGWKGIIVEPVKRYLDNIPRKENIQYANNAIWDVEGKLDFQVWKDEWVEKDNDYKGMSSFHNKKENYPALDIIKVDCLTVSSLLKKYPVPRIDFLKIDTEGSDYVVLSQFIGDEGESSDLSPNLRPKLIKCEIKHYKKRHFEPLFKDKGYQVYYEKDDLYAIDLL